MATQYTSILKLALPVQGELDGTWGDTVNDSITSMVEEAIAGRKVINTWTTNSHTLTTADGATSESRAAILSLTDTGTALTGAGTVICPAASKIYIVENGTGQSITVKTSSGTGVAVPDGTNMVVFCDGTNVEEGITNINSLTISGDTTISGNATVTGTASFSGDVAVDTDTLFVDVSEEKVGVNTTTLNSTFEVFGGDLGGTSGDAVDVATFRTTSSNVDRLDISTERTATGTDWQSAAQKIQRRVDTTDMGYVQFGSQSSDLITFGKGTTEYAQISGDGYLGLGVTPNVLLHLGTAGPQIRFDDTDANGICQIFQGTNVLYVRVDPTELDANSQLRFEVDNAEKLRIDDGKVSFYCGSELEDTTITSSSNAATIDLDNGDSFVHDLTENVTYTFSNPAASGKASAFILKVIQDATARTITWPTSVDWAGGTAPTLSTGDNDVDIFVFYTNDGGTTYYGSVVGQDFA